MLDVITLWRPEWNATQRLLMQWMLQEVFPARTRFIWLSPTGSETERELEAQGEPWLDRGPEHSLKLIATPPPRVASVREKHETIAGLYNAALEQVSGERVLVIEDDVIAPPGAVHALLGGDATLPADAAAMTAAYRSRTLPGCMCASGEDGRYLPWPGREAVKPVECAWLGGGFTLYRTRWLRHGRPFFVREQQGIIYGWDVNLCRQIRAAGGRLFVHTGVRAEHRCAEVISYCAKSGAALAD